LKCVLPWGLARLDIEPNLAKVGAEGSNPFARSDDFNALGDRRIERAMLETVLPGEYPLRHARQRPLNGQSVLVSSSFLRH
jgi:hypothetical protein